MKTRQYWSDGDIAVLRKLYEVMGLGFTTIAQQLNRDVQSIKNKIDRLKLKHTKEQTRNIKSALTSGSKNPMYGKSGWKLGLTKETDERIKISSIKISNTRKQKFKQGLLPILSGAKNPMYGKSSWSKGLTKETDERIRKSSEKMIKTQKQNWNLLSEEEKIHKRKHCALIGANCKKRKTSIEIIIEKILSENMIEYISGYYKDNMVFDFYLPKLNVVIECQGDYWHSNPLYYNENNINDIQRRNIERDIRKKLYLKNNGINSLFLWETDIKKNINNVKNQLIGLNSYKNIERM